MKGSYQFERLEQRHVEAAFLAERAQLRLEGFPALLGRHGFPDRGRTLEVGCGQGIRTERMAALAPAVNVVGIDRSPELLDQARASHAVRSNLSFQLADLHALPFEEGSFDFVYARLVFMHLEDPLRALAGLQRMLRPGGRLLIEDADRDCMFFEPAPSSFPAFWRKVQDGQRRHGGDPNIGRKLAPLLKEAGFVDVRPEVQPLSGAGAEIAFLVRTLLPSLNTYLEPEDRLDGSKAIEDLMRLSADPRATFFHFWFAVSAAKRAR